MIGDMAVHHALTRDPADYVRHLREMLHKIATGQLILEMPSKQVFGDPGRDSDFRVMPCVVRGEGRETKIVKVVGTNIRQASVPDQITVGKALVLDPVENFITHIVDACLLSSARTGACAALAAAILATRRRRLTVIGSGRVGYYAALYSAAACGLCEVVFADHDPQRAGDAAAALSLRMPELTCHAMSLDALPETDIVVLATTSRHPLCRPPAWQAGLVISLGADIDHQSELDTAWAQTPRIHVDTQDSARFGDLRQWLDRGLIRPDSIVDLFTLLRQDAPASEECQLFVSTGSALFDNLTLDYLLHRGC